MGHTDMDVVFPIPVNCRRRDGVRWWKPQSGGPVGRKEERVNCDGGSQESPRKLPRSNLYGGGGI